MITAERLNVSYFSLRWHCHYPEPLAFAQETVSDYSNIHFAFDHVALILDSVTVKAMAESPLLKNEFFNSRYR